MEYIDFTFCTAIISIIVVTLMIDAIIGKFHAVLIKNTDIIDDLINENDVTIKCGELPPHDSPYWSNFNSESLTSTILNFITDSGVFGMFINDPKLSVTLCMKDTDEIMGTSATADFSKYYENMKKVTPKLLNSDISENAKKFVKLNDTSCDMFKMIDSRSIKLHNAGICVAEKFRGKKIKCNDGSVMTVGQYIFREKLRYLKELCGDYLLFTNANNRGSAKIFEKSGMKLVRFIPYSLIELNHPDGFVSFVYVSV